MTTNYLRHIAASLALSLFTAIPVHADILSLGFLSGFTANQADADSAPTILSNGVVQLTHSSAGEVRSLIDDTKQSIDQFTADFTYQTNQQPLSTDGGFGATLVLENNGTNVVASNNEGIHTAFGLSDWSGVFHTSVAISLEFGSLSAGSSSTGAYQDAAVNGGSSSTAPVDLFSGDPIHAHITYDGSVLSTTFTDTVTNQSFGPIYYPINIRGIVGADTAYVGFTANTNASDQGAIFSDFSFITAPAPEPSSVVLLALGMLGLLPIAKRGSNAFRTTAGPL